MIKTVNLTANTVLAVEKLGGANTRIVNRTAALLYAGRTDSIAKGQDNVLTIPSGKGDYLEGTKGTVYLLSDAGGEVQLEGTDSFRPFDNAAEEKGGTVTGNPVVIDNLEGGVPFSEISVSGKNLISISSWLETQNQYGVDITVSDFITAANGTLTKDISVPIVGSIHNTIRKPKIGDIYTLTVFVLDGSITNIDNNTRLAIFATWSAAENGTIKTQKHYINCDDGQTSVSSGFSKSIKIEIIADMISDDGNVYYTVTHYGRNGNVYSNAKFAYMLTKCNSAPTEYEPPITGQEITLSAGGKNLIPYPYYDGNSKTYNGITFTVNDDGSITANGTATSSYSIFTFSKNLKLKKGTYILSGCPEGGSDTTFNVQFANKDWSFVFVDYGRGGKTVNIDSDIELNYCRILISNGCTVENLVFRPQLELGSIATEYEKPVGSITAIVPDSNPYTVPDDIRQQDGMNVVSASGGGNPQLTVSYSKTDPALSRIYKSIDSLATAIVALGAEN
ncbi:MAG: hypothetical protein ACI4J1_02495 [Ruminiclostridium sp.]